MSSYKTCAVPMCKSTTIRSPDKLFIHVPKCAKRRKQWVMLARRNPDVTSKNGTIYFCEDHFDLPNDMENYMEYKIMGCIKQIRMKRNCLPSKFECQPDRQKRLARATHTAQRSLAIKRQQKYIVQSILEESEHQSSLGSTNTSIIDVNQAYSPNITNMTVPCNEFAERLFLLKNDSEEISVPCKDLAPHQIDGIRFLFKQYKKMKQGVIINYPSGCGASAQVALFISAIQKDLEKPVLILYDKVKDSWEWLERFSKWTTISADSIVCDAPNPYVKKLVYINNIANIDKLCARQWSIVIVKSDEVNQKFLRYLLKVNFKIWITSVDMRKDRTALKVIYSWMYDKSKTEINKFLHHKTDAKESYINNLLLDSLLEDVLLTRRDLTPFQNKKRRHEPEIKVAPKISRKNKDATGLKIKRTKKTIDNESIAQQSINIKVDIEDEETKSDVESINIKVDDEDEETKLDVESFIRDNEPLESDSNFSMAISSLDCATHTSLPVNPKTEDASTHSFVKFRRSVNKIVDIDQSSALSIQLSYDSSQESISGNEIKPESGRYSNLSTLTIKDEEEEVENKSDLSNPDSTISSQNSRGLYLEFSNGSSLESDIVKDEEIEAGEEECDTTKMMPKIGEVFSLGVVKNESSDEEGNAIKKETEMCSDDSNDGEVTGDQDGKLELTTRVTQETENNFDLKMKQMEERALKKFKGSFLDNMFKM